MNLIIILAMVILLITIVLSNIQNTDDIVITVPSEAYYKYFEYASIEYNNSTKTSQDIVIEVDTLENTLEEITSDSSEQADMFFTPSYLMPLLAEKEVIMQIEYDMTNYSEDTYHTTLYNGEAYLLPMEFATPIFIYDPNYYEKAPTLVGELNPEDWAANFYSLIISEIFIYQLWGYVYAFDNTSNVNPPEAVEFFTTIQSYYANDIGIWDELTDPMEVNDQIVEAYINDEIQAMIIPSTYVSELSSSQVSFKTTVMPTVNEYNDAHTYSSTYGLVVNSNTESKKTCQDFISFINTPKMMQSFVDITGNASPYLVQREDTTYSYYIAQDIENIYNSIPHYKSTWLLEDMKVFSEIMYDILVLQEDVDKSLEKFDEQHLLIVEAAQWEEQVSND